MGRGSTFLAALLAICWFQMLVPNMPTHVAYWRVLLSAAGGAAAAMALAWVTDKIRDRQLARRRLR